MSVDVVNASTNINSTPNEHWGWNDVVGWIDFYNTNSVNVLSPQLQGYAYYGSSTAAYVSLDCGSVPPPPGTNICDPGNGNYKVINDGGGNLSGWAWNDTYGWISFWCGDLPGGTCSPTYRVFIDGSGYFHGYAWNDIIGWISFNCIDVVPPAGGICGLSNYKVGTSWRPVAASGTLDSTIYDTGVASGAQLNSFLWQGNQPAGTAVRFQFATSNASSGPWNFIGPAGTGGMSDYYDPGNPNVSMPMNALLHNNQRYFRYRVILVSNSNQTLTPQVDEVIVNWSP